MAALKITTAPSQTFMPDEQLGLGKQRVVVARSERSQVTVQQCQIEGGSTRRTALFAAQSEIFENPVQICLRLTGKLTKVIQTRVSVAHPEDDATNIVNLNKHGQLCWPFLLTFSMMT